MEMKALIFTVGLSFGRNSIMTFVDTRRKWR
jgi:hypothetical protein